MENIILRTENLSIFYGEKQSVKDINMYIYKNKVTAIMGPSGCGKTTLIRSFNRMQEINPGVSVKGKIFLNIYINLTFILFKSVKFQKRNK